MTVGEWRTGQSDEHCDEGGPSARCIPDDAARPSLTARVEESRDVDDSRFTDPSRASLSGGEGPVREDANRKLTSEPSVYRVTRHLIESAPRWNQAVRGTVLVQGPRISVAQRAWEQSARIVMRESDF